MMKTPNDLTGLCGPASVCIPVLRTSFNPKSLFLTKWKEKQGNGSKQQLYKLTSALCFKSPFQQVQEIEFIIHSLFLCLSTCFQVSVSLQSLLRSHWVHCICTTIQLQAHIIPLISPNPHIGGSIPVTLDTQISRDSDWPMLEDWYTSTDSTVLHSKTWRWG